MLKDRLKLYKKLETDRNSTVIAYVTGDRRGLETKVSSEAVDLFVHHLDHIGVVDKLTLFLYTRGGDTLAAWSLINLLRIFAEIASPSGGRNRCKNPVILGEEKRRISASSKETKNLEEPGSP